MHRVFTNPEDPIEFRKFLDGLNDLYSTDKQFLFKDNHYRISYLSIQRWILAQPFKGQTLCLRNLLLDAMMSASNLFPGSEIWVPFLLRNEIMPASKIQRLSSAEYLKHVLALSKNERAKNIFKELYKLSGPLTRINLKKTKAHQDVVKYRNCFQFPVKIDKIFQQMVNTEAIEMWSPKIILIEGAPSSVGELNALLEDCHTKGTNLVLIARSFPEEVSATLATNWIRNSLNVLPIVYGNSIDTINLAADLAAVTQSDLVTPMMGDSISTAVLQQDKQGGCERIVYTPSGFQIYKEVDVSRHLNNLLEKIKNTEEEELQQVYSDRIFSLSNDSIELQVNDHNPICLDELDQMIKHYNAYIQGGLQTIGGRSVPKILIDYANTVTESLKSEILKIAGFLLVVADGDLV